MRTKCLVLHETNVIDNPGSANSKIFSPHLKYIMIRYLYSVETIFIDLYRDDIVINGVIMGRGGLWLMN